MVDIKQDDIISKTDMLLFDILEELKKRNKPLRPVAMGTGVKKKPKPRKPKPKPKPIIVKTETLEVQDERNTNP